MDLDRSWTEELNEKYLIGFNTSNSNLNISIFTSDVFLSLHKDKYLKIIKFQLINKKSLKSECDIQFGTKDLRKFVSPVAGTFGFFNLKEIGCLESMHLYINAVIKFLKSATDKVKIEIRCPQLAYNFSMYSELLNLMMLQDGCIQKMGPWLLHRGK